LGIMPKHHYHRIHPRLRGVRARHPRDLPVGSLSPEQVLTAYGFRQNQYAGAPPVKLGIGSLGGGVVQRDIDNAVATWSMTAPALTVRTVGGATNNPTIDHDSNVENMLDLLLVSFTWWWLTGSPADVTITFGPNATGGMEAVTRDLVAAGVEVASWSWGAAASEWDPTERAALAQAFGDAVDASVCFCAASGDNSIDDGTGAPSADYPCADVNVWAVGGTRLAINPDGSRADEAAWGDGNPGDEGGGGGFDSTELVPGWQTNALPANAPGRGVPDTAANADPNSGWQISANGMWTVVGGTSASSPFTAALVAVAKGVAKQLGDGLTAPAVYRAATTACNDITRGSDGAPATAGWDEATGLGSPKGDGFVQAVAAYAQGSQPAPEPPAPAPPPPPPPSPPGTTPLTLDQAVTWAALGIRAGDPLQTQDQAIANATAGLKAGAVGAQS
jgi:kumamolisin